MKEVVHTQISLGSNTGRGGSETTMKLGVTGTRSSSRSVAFHAFDLGQHQ